VKATHVTRDVVAHDIMLSARRRYVTAKDWRGKAIVRAHFWWDEQGTQRCWLLLADRSVALLRLETGLIF
jgi:hypothetical protein